jgi:hypothetical protein
MDNIVDYIIIKYINIENVIKLTKNNVRLNLKKIKIYKYYIWNELIITYSDYDIFNVKRIKKLNEFLFMCKIFGINDVKCGKVYSVLINSNKEKIRKIEELDFLLGIMIKYGYIEQVDIDLIIKLISINSKDWKSLRILFKYKMINNIKNCYKIRNIYDYLRRGNNGILFIKVNKYPLKFHRIIFETKGFNDIKRKILNHYIFGVNFRDDVRNICINLHKIIGTSLDTYIKLTADSLENNSLYNDISKWKFMGMTKLNSIVDDIKNISKHWILQKGVVDSLDSIDLSNRYLKINKKSGLHYENFHLNNINDIVMDIIRQEINKSVKRIFKIPTIWKEKIDF